MFNYVYQQEVECLTTKTHPNSIALRIVAIDQLDRWKKSLTAPQRKWSEANNFSARNGEVLIFSNAEGGVDFVAAGDDQDFWGFSKIAASLPDGHYHFEDKIEDNMASLAVFGWAMAHYNFDPYLKKKKSKSCVLRLPDNCDYENICAVVNGTTLARDLVNTPTCDMGPTELAEVATIVAKTFNAKISVIEGEELLGKGLNTIHTVGRAAEKAPRLIDITWGDANAPKLTLVGKGVCFDTGGLDIKPSNAMLIMKKDMGGAAHVLGLALMIMQSGLNVRLRVLIPAVENNIAGNAFRPGDIIKSYKGTTIEVGNTDAEGRLVLCDALALACEEDPELLLDFATLTGAARVALGTDVPPYFTDDQDLSSAILKYSEIQQDPLWPLPLYKPYKNLLNSKIADINNVASTGFGGAITAALFLKEFVDPNISWAHFDVYAWNASARSGRPPGGEAMGIRAVFEYLTDRYNGPSAS